MAILMVGAGYAFQTIGAAVAAAQDGDVVEVAAGTYTNDFVTITHSITLEAVGGMAVITATEPPPDRKAIITEGGTGENVTISGFELTGAAVSAGDGSNGAGIRYEGGNLTLNNDYIHDNQEGILGNPAVTGTGTVSISNSEFANNGGSSGLTHNIYIGKVAELRITNSYIRGAVAGHEIKSRAYDTVITGNRIDDGPTGTASYSIDLPVGGNATVTGNVIQQGPASQNYKIIAYGEEEISNGGSQVPNPGTSVTLSDNTILNEINSTKASAVWNTTTNDVTFSNNQVYGLGPGQLVVGGPGSISGTQFLATEPVLDTSSPWSGSAQPPGVTCFASGTRIATAHGEVAVEHLREGDLVATAANGLRPVRWIGTRGVDCRRHPAPEKVWPVRVLAGAFAPNQPQRDLRLSPEHAVFTGEGLIPIRCLVNGATIVREQVESVTYWHVELAVHDVIIAEGLACESYLDCGNRDCFANGGVFLALHPDFARRSWEADACAPLYLAGPAVAAVRTALRARAGSLGYRRSADPDLRLAIDGRVLLPEAVAGGVWRFRLPAGTSSAVLLSRVACDEADPPENAGYYPLGVRLARLVQCAGGTRHDIALSDPALGRGLWQPERDRGQLRRWTNGAAVIPLSLPCIDALEVHVSDTQTYWTRAAATEAPAAGDEATRPAA